MSNVFKKFSQKDLAENIIHDIFDELTDRSGFNGWWDGIDGDIQQEIRNTLTDLTVANLQRQDSLKE